MSAIEPMQYQAPIQGSNRSRWSPLVKTIAIVGLVAGSLSVASATRMAFWTSTSFPISSTWSPPAQVKATRYSHGGKSATAGEIAKQLWLRIAANGLGGLGLVVGGILLVCNLSIGRIVLLVGTGFVLFYRGYDVTELLSSLRKPAHQVFDRSFERLCCVMYFALFACLVLLRRGLFRRA